jgi:helix-turn-helix protein
MAPIHTKEALMSKNSLNSSPITISVPEAGKKYFGLCRNAAYDAAARGEIPTIKIGRLLRVPIRALERMIERASEPMS